MKIINDNVKKYNRYHFLIVEMSKDQYEII